MSKLQITVCLGSSCFARGNEGVLELIQQYLEQHSYQNDVDVELSGALCQERCADGPNVIIDGTFYTNVDSGVMTDLLKKILPPKS